MLEDGKSVSELVGINLFIKQPDDERKGSFGVEAKGAGKRRPPSAVFFPFYSKVFPSFYIFVAKFQNKIIVITFFFTAWL